MEPFLKDLLSEYGPLALGWIVASFLAYRVFSDASTVKTDARDALRKYDDLVKAYHECIVDNTKVTERLALLIEDRVRRQLNDR
jgi:hypothetical protein